MWIFFLKSSIFCLFLISLLSFIYNPHFEFGFWGKLYTENNVLKIIIVIPGFHSFEHQNKKKFNILLGGQPPCSLRLLTPIAEKRYSISNGGGIILTDNKYCWFNSNYYSLKLFFFPNLQLTLTWMILFSKKSWKVLYDELKVFLRSEWYRQVNKQDYLFNFWMTRFLFWFYKC